MKLTELDNIILTAIRDRTGLIPGEVRSICDIQARLAKLKMVGLITPSKARRDEPGYRYDLTDLGCKLLKSCNRKDAKDAK